MNMNVHEATNVIRAFLSQSSATIVLLAVMYVTRLGVEGESRVRARAMVATTTHDRIAGTVQREADFWIDIDERAVVAWSPSIQHDDDEDVAAVAPYIRGGVLSGAPKNKMGDHHSSSLERLTRAYQAGIDLASTLAVSSATSGNRVVAAAADG